MTVLRVTPLRSASEFQFFGFEMQFFSFSDPVMDWRVLERTASSFAVSAFGFSLTFEGSDFRYRGQDDVTDVKAGRIETITFRLYGDALVTFSNLDKTAGPFFDFVYKNLFPSQPGGQQPMAYLLSGNDQIYGGQGKDGLFGYNGNDRLYGGNFEDTLSGGRGNDRLFGGGFNDTLSGGQGNDRLNGGLDHDQLTGGRGRDSFIFGTQAAAWGGSFNADDSDRITDFNRADDRILFENAVFADLGREGDLRRVQFEVGEEATRTSTRILHDRTGRDAGIYYDPDGSGGRDQFLIAQVTSGLTLSSADFLVI